MTAVLPTVALMSPGDMGHAVGALLRRHGLRVITSIEGRSDRTRALAVKAGLDMVADDRTLVEEADLLLSIMVPAQAEPFAGHIASILEQTAHTLTYVDCNAIAPQTARNIGTAIEASGSAFIDAGIIGPPPKEDSRATRIYASGVHADRFARLNEHGLDVRVIGENIGDASAIKMCYAALTKGTTALMTALSVTAERLGISDDLRAEFELSQGPMLARMQGQVPAMVPKARRWVGEMEEIAKTFGAASVTPKIFEGAAAVYQDVAKSSLGKVAQEEWNDTEMNFGQVIESLSRKR